MTRSAALKTTRDEKVRDAKRAFLLSLLDISWRLAAIFLAPVFVGIASGKAVAGIITGIVLAVLFIIKLGVDSSKAIQ